MNFLKVVICKYFSIVIILASSFLTSFVLADTKPMTAVDIVALTRLSQPSVSADGRYLVYLRSEVNWAKNKEVKRYRFIDLETGDAIQGIEPEKPTESFGSAVWVGSEGIITLLEREEDDDKQAYFYELEGGSLTRLTEHKSDVKSISWASDNSGFYFRSREPLTEQEDKDLENDWVLKEYETRRFHELWFFNWQTRESSKLFGGDFNVRGYELSRDSKKILYAKTEHDLGDGHDRELWLYDIESGKHQVLTRNTYAEYGATLSPQSNQFAFIATVNSKGEQYYEDNVFIQDVGASNPVAILPDIVMEMNAVEWDKEGTGLYILGNTGVREHLYHYSIETKELVAITSGDSVINSWSYDSELDTHVFKLVSDDNPGEIWLYKNGDEKSRQITNEYAGFSDKFDLPKQRVFSWQGRKSQKLEGLLVYPLNHDKKKPFPLVTITHGGPRSSSQFGSWNYSRYVPVLTGQGYGVFLPNHRGGTGYGDKFVRDMVGNYFRHSHHDVMDGIDALIDQELADPEQLIKMGWSAGGHMTNKLITTTDRFKAASSGAGASDWVSMYAESDVRHNRTPWFGSTPWSKNSNHRNFYKQSTLKDAWRVTTPTLFFVGEDDVRVPPTQSIMMYRGVKAAGAETKLYIAPEQPHGYKKPSYRLFKLNTELEWFARHLGKDPYTPVYPAAKDVVDKDEKQIDEKAQENQEQSL